MADPDGLVRLAKRDAREAAELLLDTLQADVDDLSDWPDDLARRNSRYARL